MIVSIINSTHSLTPELVKSMQEYRQQLVEKRQQEKITDVSISIDQSSEVEKAYDVNDPYVPVDPVDPSAHPLDSSLTDQTTPMDTLGQNIQENRDRARETAVKANQINHANNMAETYINASSSQNNNSSNSEISGVKVYTEIRDYYKRQDMINAFEKAREPEDLWSYDYQEIRVEV